MRSLSKRRDDRLKLRAETLAERRELRLSAKQYDAFVAALDSPVKPKARLEKLITMPGVLE